MRKFNVTGLCVPEEDYMADVSGKIAQIKNLIDDRSYFTINRARQYGKTTILHMLKRVLVSEYQVASISFEGLGDESFETPEKFCYEFMRLIKASLQSSGANDNNAGNWYDENVTTFSLLSSHITTMCKEAKVVLLIDEVDKTSNNRVFLHFLSMLRSKFLARKSGDDFTFHSVVLAGVYDIKNIKLKMIREGAYSPNPIEGALYNSPWNIAVNFEIDLSFMPDEIASMLVEYEKDCGTGMDISEVSEEIYSFSGGYPFLVSRICQCIHDKLDADWTVRGVQSAVSTILLEKNVLFDDMAKNLENNGELYDFLYCLLIVGERRSFVIDNPIINLGAMYGYITSSRSDNSAGQSGYAVISNKVFELRMSNYFISKDENTRHMDNIVFNGLHREITANGRFDMELCLRKFAEHYEEIFSDRDASFHERHGRLLFLSYLKPLINGHGFYHIESQFTDTRRMDVVVDFGQQQFIIELKVWRGEQYQAEAYEQLCGYLKSRRAGEGYLLTFDFRKNRAGAADAGWKDIGWTRIFEVIV